MEARLGANRQRGAALIISLVLLSVALMLGISAMQSSLLDERMAGNHRFATQARMAAEAATAELAGWLGERPSRPWSASLAAQLDTPLDEWPACGGNARDGVRLEVADNAWAWLLACREDGERMMQVQGEAGAVEHAARYPGRVPLRLAGYSGLATATFIGGLTRDADIQWPTSEASRLSGEDQAGLHDAIPAVLVEYRSGDDETYSASGLHATVNSEAKVLEGRIVESEPSSQSLALLRAIHDTCFEAGGRQGRGKGRGNGNNQDGGSQLCDHLLIVPPGGEDPLKGSRRFDGLYINLNGELDIRGNATVHGAAIVANITVDEDGVWQSAPNETIKLAGGGNSGSVWFDSFNANAAINELKASSGGSAFAELSLENFFGQSSGEGAGLRLDGWLR
ncbi:hypothetical protein HPA02_33860 [Bisbaumannia pacifica]|uniref:Type 4 fimbrial biogenesis protein PilX N-terminal domain-containing protein n=1 Tax=Bisbaumannia pacifica TaxID=77098 RepID=A0A510XCI3_9GAMM|nr:PilX N-terminal domain-containing pilus assembly protein [Halomonas pacifica]GEK49103.1 hypothetical protein HPA02_33860 [Halomonas pacifica]